MSVGHRADSAEPRMTQPATTGALFDEVAAGQPLLELDNGIHLVGASSICLYLEEMFPDPCLLGATALERAHTEMWQRQIETHLMSPLAVYCFHGAPGGTQGEDNEALRSAAWGKKNLHLAQAGIRDINSRLSGSKFLTGQRFSAADIYLWSALDFARVFEVEVPAECESIKRWHNTVNEHIGKRDSLERPPKLPKTPSVSDTEQQQTTAQLSTSKPKISETSRILILDREGRFRYANDEALSFYGKEERKNIVGSKLQNRIIDPEFFARAVKPNIERCLDEKKAFNRRGWAYYTGGVRSFVTVEFSPFDDESVLLVIRDLYRIEPSDADATLSTDDRIPNRSRADAERTAMLDAVMGSNTGRVAVLSRTGNFLYANKTALEYYSRRSLEDVVGRHVSEWSGADHYREVLRPVIRRCFTGETGALVSSYTDPCGRELTVELDYFPYHERTGVISGAILQVSKTVDAADGAETPVANASDVVPVEMTRINGLVSILSTTKGDRISVVDRNYRYLYINNAVLEAFKCETDTFTGRTIEQCIGKDQFEGIIKQRIDRAFDGEYTYQRFWYEDPTAGRRIFAMEFYPVSDVAGEGEVSAVIIKVHPRPESADTDEGQPYGGPPLAIDAPLIQESNKELSDFVPPVESTQTLSK